jgi:hypothetical protein
MHFYKFFFAQGFYKFLIHQLLDYTKEKTEYALFFLIKACLMGFWMWLLLLKTKSLIKWPKSYMYLWSSTKLKTAHFLLSAVFRAKYYHLPYPSVSSSLATATCGGTSF